MLQRRVRRNKYGNLPGDGVSSNLREVDFSGGSSLIWRGQWNKLVEEDAVNGIESGEGGSCCEVFELHLANVQRKD